MNYSASCQRVCAPASRRALMAVGKEKPRPPAAGPAPDERTDAFAAVIGSLVRSARGKRGITRRQLAEQSRTSERYLAQIESGQGNPSVVVLKSIAEALDLPMIELLPRTRGCSEALERIVDLLMRLPQSELPVIADLIERRAGRRGHPARRDRPRRLRRAGQAAPGARPAPP